MSITSRPATGEKDGRKKKKGKTWIKKEILKTGQKLKRKNKRAKIEIGLD
jgi:hypothetical protein